MSVYFSKMRKFAEEMAAAGKQLDTDDIVSHILNGLDAEYNPLVEQVTSMTAPMSLDDFYARLLSTEARLESQKDVKESFQMVANSAARGRGGRGRSRFDSGRGYPGGRNGSGRGNLGRGGNPNNPYRDHECQVCGKTVILLFGAGSGLTRISMALRKQLLLLSPPIMLTRRGMPTVQPRIILLAILTN